MSLTEVTTMNNDNLLKTRYLNIKVSQVLVTQNTLTPKNLKNLSPCLDWELNLHPGRSARTALTQKNLKNLSTCLDWEPNLHSDKSAQTTLAQKN